MPAPFGDFVLRLSREHREIDNHHHFEVTARTSEDFVEGLTALQVAQREAADANLHAIAQSGTLHAESNLLLTEVLASLRRTNRLLEDTSTSVRLGLTLLATQMFQQQITLQQIAAALVRPYGTQVQELLDAAHLALAMGGRTIGKEQHAAYTDAARFFDKVLTNPIGSMHYIAWLRRGWLFWKFEDKIDDAETAFFNSVRLSRDAADHFHIDALRHMAYMQYLKTRYADAYQTIQQAIHVSPVYEVLYDAARYAARSGRREDAIRLIERCIDIRPETIDTMFSEQDFLV